MYTSVFFDADTRVSGVYLQSKRIFDATFATMALVTLLPILLLVALLVKVTSRGPVIFSQWRCGKHGIPYRIYKFRSMVVEAEKQLKFLRDLNERDGPVFKITNDPRHTIIGGFLRKSCLDELPQLWNIVKGDMSFVGPRPALPEEVAQYKTWQFNRLAVTPGLTCHWQISNRNMTFDEWVRSDLDYIDNRSFGLDMLLILKTLPVFVTGHK